MKRLITFVPYIALFIFSIPVIMPYFHAGYFPTHDGLWAVVRLGDMFRELKDHQFPPRYSGNLNFGYGYPLFNFAYPFPYYLGIIFHFLHFSFINSIKIIFALTVPFSAWGMYKASSTLWKNQFAGWVSALLYVYLPYRMVDLYVRGSIGESVAFVTFPLLVLAICQIVRNPLSKRWMVIGGVMLSILITSHNIMAILFTPVLIAVGIAAGWRNIKAFFTLFQSLILGICLSAFFWIPALVEKNLILLSKIPIADRNLYYVSLQQLILPSWHYGIPGSVNGFTYQIGLPLVVLFLCIVGSIVLYKKNSLVLTMAISVIAMIAMLFSWSGILWQHIPLLQEINYPWTLLGPIGFLLALLSGYLMTMQQRWIKGLVGIAIVGALFLVIPYAHPEKYIYPDDNYFLTNDATTTSSTEYIPLWVKKWPTERPSQKATTTNGVVSNLFSNSLQSSFTVTTDAPAIVTLNTIYYPGWIIKVDNIRVPVQYDNPQGVMQFHVLPGTHTVLAHFTESPLRAGADAISLASLFFGVSYFLIAYIPEKKKKS